MIATISTTPIYRQPTPRLHNSRTNWNNYRTKIHEKINPHISLKSCTEVQEATNNFINLLQETAQATPKTVHKKRCCEHTNRNYETVGREKKSNSNMAKKSHPVRKKTASNRLSNHLKLKAMRANSLKFYVSTLSRYDNSIWKPIKSTGKPTCTLASPHLRLETPTQKRLAISNKEKAAVFAEHLADAFQPHAQETDEEILEYLESPAQSVEPTKLITPKEIEEEIRLLNAKKKPGMDITTPKMPKELPQKGMVLLIYLMPYSDINIGLIN